MQVYYHFKALKSMHDFYKVTLVFWYIYNKQILGDRLPKQDSRAEKNSCRAEMHSGAAAVYGPAEKKAGSEGAKGYRTKNVQVPGASVTVPAGCGAGVRFGSVLSAPRTSGLPFKVITVARTFPPSPASV